MQKTVSLQIRLPRSTENGCSGPAPTSGATAGPAKPLWAGFYNNHELSDVSLSFVPLPGQQKSKAPKQPADKGLLTALPCTFAAHSLVLASASDYWKTRLLRWSKPDSSSDQHRPDVNPGHPCAKVLEETVSEEELAGVKAALQWMYTWELPDSVADLMRTVLIADKWQVQELLPVCLQKLLSIVKANPKNLNGSDLARILPDTVPDSVAAHTTYKQVQEACKAAYPTIVAAMKPEELFSWVCSLPYTVLHQLLSSDSVKFDCENTVVVLISHWWDHHGLDDMDYSPDDMDLSASISSKLSSLVKVQQLSPSFFSHVLRRLPWFTEPTKGLLSVVQMIREAGQQHHNLQKMSAHLPPAWRQPGRNLANGYGYDSWGDGYQQCTRDAPLLSLDTAALLKLKKAQSPAVAFRARYHGGYMWKVIVELDSSVPAKPRLGVRVSSAVPGVPHMPRFLPAHLRLTEVSSTGQSELLDMSDAVWDEDCGELTCWAKTAAVHSIQSMWQNLRSADVVLELRIEWVQ